MSVVGGVPGGGWHCFAGMWDTSFPVTGRSVLDLGDGFVLKPKMKVFSEELCSTEGM